MTEAEITSVLGELTTAYGQANRLKVICEEAGKFARARRLRARVAALKRQKDRLARRLLRTWTGDAAALAADLARRNEELAARTEELRQDMARGAVFTSAVECLDEILAVLRKIP